MHLACFIRIYIAVESSVVTESAEPSGSLLRPSNRKQESLAYRATILIPHRSDKRHSASNAPCTTIASVRPVSAKADTRKAQTTLKG
eukprot:3416133-Amphidinium_carterae.1